MAAQNLAAEYEHQKFRAEAELNRVRTQLEGEVKLAQSALTEASSQAAHALQQLAEVQSASAAQITKMQSELTAAMQKTHQFELQLVRAQVLLEAKQPSKGVRKDQERKIA